jgi:hypothetical protein
VGRRRGLQTGVARTLTADVRRATGTTRHIIHGRESEPLNIARVEIEPGDGGFFQFRFSSSGECLADTWHPSLEEAKGQACFELEIDESDRS